MSNNYSLCLDEHSQWNEAFFLTSVLFLVMGVGQVSAPAPGLWCFHRHLWWSSCPWFSLWSLLCSGLLRPQSRLERWSPRPWDSETWRDGSCYWGTDLLRPASARQARPGEVSGRVLETGGDAGHHCRRVAVKPGYQASPCKWQRQRWQLSPGLSPELPNALDQLRLKVRILHAGHHRGSGYLPPWLWLPAL